MARAVQLAEQLQTASRGRNPLVLDVLAAAYAEQGDFQRAVTMVEQALRQLHQGNAGLQRVPAVTTGRLPVAATLPRS